MGNRKPRRRVTRDLAVGVIVRLQRICGLQEFLTRRGTVVTRRAWFRRFEVSALRRDERAAA